MDSQANLDLGSGDGDGDLFGAGGGMSGSSASTEMIEFRAVAPDPQLTGLDDTLEKLRAIATALDVINQRLSGLSTHSAFTRSMGGIADQIREMEKRKGKLTMKEASEALGFDPKDVKQYYLREEERLAEAVKSAQKKRSSLRGAAHEKERAELLKDEHKLQGELNTLRRTFEGQQKKLSGAGTASQFFYGYQKAAVKKAKTPIDMLQFMFGGAASAAPRSVTQMAPPHGGSFASLSALDMVVPTAKLHATLGPGAISLVVPAAQVHASAASPLAGAAAAAVVPGVPAVPNVAAPTTASTALAEVGPRPPVARTNPPRWTELVRQKGGKELQREMQLSRAEFARTARPGDKYDAGAALKRIYEEIEAGTGLGSMTHPDLRKTVAGQARQVLQTGGATFAGLAPEAKQKVTALRQEATSLEVQEQSLSNKLFDMRSGKQKGATKKGLLAHEAELARVRDKRATVNKEWDAATAALPKERMTATVPKVPAVASAAPEPTTAAPATPALRKFEVTATAGGKPTVIQVEAGSKEEAIAKARKQGPKPELQKYEVTATSKFPAANV